MEDKAYPFNFVRQPSVLDPSTGRDGEDPPPALPTLVPSEPIRSRLEVVCGCLQLIKVEPSRMTVADFMDSASCYGITPPVLSACMLLVGVALHRNEPTQWMIPEPKSDRDIAELAEGLLSSIEWHFECRRSCSFTEPLLKPKAPRPEDNWRDN